MTYGSPVIGSCSLYQSYLNFVETSSPEIIYAVSLMTFSQTFVYVPSTVSAICHVTHECNSHLCFLINCKFQYILTCVTTRIPLSLCFKLRLIQKDTLFAKLMTLRNVVFLK
jgi:hypothetical protein